MAKDSVRVQSRGIGVDWGTSCLACGPVEKAYMANVSMFVASKQDGEDAVLIIGNGARLDYRDREPDWIQVKVTACPKHEGNLRTFVASVTPPMTEEVTAEKARNARASV